MRISRSTERRDAPRRTVSGFVQPLHSRYFPIMFRVSPAAPPLCALLVSILLSPFCFGADLPIPTPPTVDARSYVVVDYHTDKTLAALDADARMEPASLTKLMTAYLVFQELAAGKLKLQDQVMVSEHAWRSEG